MGKEEKGGGDGIWKGLSSIQWKNARAKKNEMYKPTPVEHIANILTHGVS
jgi:hypothetical protein